MAINPATLAAEAELNTFLTTITDSQTKVLTDAWVTAWDSVAGELEAAMSDLSAATTGGRVTRTQILRSQRAQAAMAAVSESLDTAGRATTNTVLADLWSVLDAGSSSEYSMIASQLSGVKREALAASLIRADPVQIQAMVTRATQQITSLTRPLAAQTYDAVKRELLKGIAIGNNPRTAARRMVAAANDKADLGLSRALTIARTEMLDACRVSAQVVDNANADVLAGWIWLTHLDATTCRGCIAEDGQLHPIEEPGPWDHQNGRCARVPKTKTWKELGFDGIDDPPDRMPNTDAWFKGLTEAQQRKILGDKGFTAWKEGRYPRSTWSAKRTSTGWRDSYGPSRPPGAGVTFKEKPSWAPTAPLRTLKTVNAELKALEDEYAVIDAKHVSLRTDIEKGRQSTIRLEQFRLMDEVRSLQYDQFAEDVWRSLGTLDPITVPKKVTPAWRETAYTRAQVNRETFSALGPEYTEIADFADGWSKSFHTVDVFRGQLSRGQFPNVAALLERGQDAPSLYRGISLRAPRVLAQYEKLQPGSILGTREVSSFTSNPKHAAQFLGDLDRATITLTKGKGLPIQTLTNLPDEEEWLIAKRLVVDSVRITEKKTYGTPYKVFDIVAHMEE